MHTALYTSLAMLCSSVQISQVYPGVAPKNRLDISSFQQGVAEVLRLEIFRKRPGKWPGMTKTKRQAGSACGLLRLLLITATPAPDLKQKAHSE